MSEEEIKRCEILMMAEEKQITQKEGAKRVGISQRHFRRLLRKYRLKRAEGIISGHHGKLSINCMSEEKKKNILNKIKADYEDFGPTFASEKHCSSGITGWFGVFVSFR